MSKICYKKKRFSAESQAIIDQANLIITEYSSQGFNLTLRQLYYQFVSRDLLANTPKNYDKLGGIISDARLAGQVDWEAIEDRTRASVANSHWDDPADIIHSCSRSFRVDKWADQDYRPEIWIEKEALSGVFEGVCEELDIRYLCCRGYTSQSEMWRSARRMYELSEDGQTPVILHFGDHDPSGIDMSRDVYDRLKLLSNEARFTFERIALNIAQVQQYNPPPNPAKTTDSRAQSYIDQFGNESWELDALSPPVLVQLVRDNVARFRNEKKWRAKVREEREGRDLLVKASENWDDVKERLELL